MNVRPIDVDPQPARLGVSMFDLPAMSGDDVPAFREPEAEAASSLSSRKERIEQVLGLGLGQAGSVVLNRQDR